MFVADPEEAGSGALPARPAALRCSPASRGFHYATAFQVRLISTGFGTFDSAGLDAASALMVGMTEASTEEVLELERTSLVIPTEGASGRVIGWAGPRSLAGKCPKIAMRYPLDAITMVTLLL